MSKYFLLLILLAVGVMPLHTQENDVPSSYHLRVPDAEEYLTAMVEITSEMDRFPSLPYYQFANAASETFFYLYPDLDDIRFNSLFEAYTEMGIGTQDLVDRGEWIRRIVPAWINENSVDLSQTQALEFEDFYITVIPRDFNADGANEYLLDIMKGQRVDRQTENCQRAEIIDYLLVQETAEGYHYIDSHIPWRGQQGWIYSGLDGGMVELRFEDINADGLPEWVVLEGGGFAGGMGMGSADVGELLVLGWRDDRLEYLIPTSYSEDRHDGMVTTSFFSTRTQCEGPYPLTVDWEFTNIDEDDALEILQEQHYADNWMCERTETKIFDWDPEADRYLYGETQIEYAEQTQNCAQRDAEEVMWTGDYRAAIPIYERALTLETYNLEASQSFNYARSLNQYLRARLAFAYMMVERAEQADSLLEALRAEEFEDVAVARFVDVLVNAHEQTPSSLQTCVAAFNNFTVGLPGPDIAPQIRVGYTGDDLYYYDNPYNPENIGCNAPEMLEEVLSSSTIPVTSSPLDYLSDLGISIRESIQTDMNGDSLSEWLVWPNVPGVEIFFAPDGDAFHVSYPNVDRFQFADAVTEWQLPEGGGSAIALMRFDWHDNRTPPWSLAHSPFGGPGGGPPFCVADDGTSEYMPGEFSLWQVQDAELIPIFSVGQCAKQLESIFPNGEGSTELHSLEIECSDVYCDTSNMVEVIYIWNEQQGTYVALPEPLPSPLPQLTLVPLPSSTLPPYPYYYSVLRAFEVRDFEAVIGMTETLAITDGEINSVLGDRYLRALALEALRRDNEALTEYVAIYDAAPESAWGILAALHFEAME